MSKSLKFAALFSVLATTGAFAAGDKLDLGRLATPDEIIAWDTDIRPDGLGLPDGSGNALVGEEIFSEKCASCHGDFGEAVDRWPVLAGGFGTLTDERPVKTIGSYWPYLSTVFDYVNKAMPFGDSGSLEPDEIYAITAYLLYLNDIVDEDFELSRENFTDIKLPNEANFFLDDRAETELVSFSGDVCMKNCKESVEITLHAAVVDVTPEGEEQETEIASADTPETEVDVVAPIIETVVLDPAQIAAGKKLFKKCKACHQIGEGASNKTGPMLNGVLGRTVGTVDGFRYSKGFVAASEDGLIWNDDTLAAFLTKPRAYIKGTKMSFAGFKKETDIQSMIIYLRSFDQ